MTPTPSWLNRPKSELAEAMQALLEGGQPLYNRLNTLRDWVNQEFTGFDLYLEDAWNERVDGETHFEYWLRSKQTYNEIGPFAYDVYKNHQDAKGVWHLDEYTHSVQLMDNLQPLVDFIFENAESAAQ